MHDTDRASDTSVAILADTGRVPFRGARFDRFCGARQDRFCSTAVTRQSFSRPEAPSFDKRCAALAPLSRAAIAHPVPQGLALRELLLGSRASTSVLPEELPGPTRVVLRTPRAGDRLFRHLRLPPPRVASQRRASCGEMSAACHSGRHFARLVTSVGQAPVHRVPQSPFGEIRSREGLL